MDIMKKINRDFVIKQSYERLFSYIINYPFVRNISFIAIDSEIDNNMSKLDMPKKIKNFFITSKSKNIKLKSMLIKKITKRIIKKVENTDIIVSIFINDNDNSNTIKEIINILIALFNAQRDNIKLINIKCDNDNYYNYIMNSIIALQFQTKREQYEYIYDITCDELDKHFEKENFCDFQNDRCIANRNKMSSKDIMGCCYSFTYNVLGDIKNKKICKFLKGKKCTTKCMACKLYTCKYLRSKGITFKAKDNVLLSSFFNKKQLRVLSCNYFISKEEIIEKLLEKNYMPYIIYYIMCKEYITVKQ